MREKIVFKLNELTKFVLLHFSITYITDTRIFFLPRENTFAQHATRRKSGIS